MSLDTLQRAIAQRIAHLGPESRTAVLDQVDGTLRVVMAAQRNIPSYTLPYTGFWAEATDYDFEQTAAMTGRPRTIGAVTAVAPWKSAVLRLRGTEVFLENASGEGYRILVAVADVAIHGSSGYERWDASITQLGKTCLGSGGTAGNPSCTTAKSRAGAVKSLRGLVNKFFKVKLTDVVS